MLKTFNLFPSTLCQNKYSLSESGFKYSGLLIHTVNHIGYKFQLNIHNQLTPLYNQYHYLNISE